MLETMALVCGLWPSVSMKERSILIFSHRESGEIAQARIAGAEIVHGDGDAELVEALQRVEHDLGVLQEDALGDLELEPMRLQPGLGQNPGDEGDDVLGLELGRREIDGERVSAGQVVA